ncbi:DoxX family protein [Hymenobacter sp.]|uniref:DoxX family protein n=1 Tax=Hymenobacter sp. TaxID=1898978 RepID=UPI00286B5A16|nr:DoxX family protein [Hymenobacter sp.]
MKNVPPFPAAWRGPAAALGMLIFRLHLGVVMVEAGWPKLEMTDWFTKQVADLGFAYPSPVLWAGLAAWGELAGGLLLILGLGTRFAAAQLAFQFFVISFLWYDKPEFFTGMYVQQELFWGFVLLMGTGAGRCSLDAWLRGKSLRNLVGRPALRKPALTSVAVLLPLLALAGDVHSVLFIEPGKQFILGGGQRGAFRVVAKNIGTVPVEIRERPQGGGTFGKATLAPGQSGVLKFAAGSTAVLLNPSRVQANLDLIITGGRNLAMTYEPVQEYGKPALKQNVE